MKSSTENFKLGLVASALRRESASYLSFHKHTSSGSILRNVQIRHRSLMSANLQCLSALLTLRFQPTGADAHGLVITAQMEVGSYDCCMHKTPQISSVITAH